MADTAAPSATSTPSALGSLIVDRTVRVDLDRGELWRSISTTQGWREWMVDAAVLDRDIADRSTGVVAGLVVDGDVVREVRIDRVEDGRLVGFTWWDRCDPSMVSHVTLEIAGCDPDAGDDGDAGVTLTIREELAGVDRFDADESSASASATRAMEARLAWEVRVGSLWACTVAAALV